MAQRRHYLFICTNRRPDDNPKGSCAAKGSEAVLKAFKEQLFQSGLAKVEARACGATCLDQCAVGVSVLVEPDHVFYGRVTVADVPEIVASLDKGTRVERLVPSPEDLERG
jgi:(2Fe-2S) ferredoxin